MDRQKGEPHTGPALQTPGCRCQGGGGPGLGNSGAWQRASLSPRSKGFGTSWGWPWGHGQGQELWPQPLGSWRAWQEREDGHAVGGVSRLGQDRAGVANPNSSHSGPASPQAGSQWGGHNNRPWPPHWPVFSTSSPPDPSSLQPPSLAGRRRLLLGRQLVEERGAGSARHSSKGSVGALRPERRKTGTSGAGRVAGCL